jgi:hypothetical protein
MVRFYPDRTTEWLDDRLDVEGLARGGLLLPEVPPYSSQDQRAFARGTEGSS